MERRQAFRKALPDILAGSIFVVLGLAFAIGSTTYEIGTPFQMGPGFFPLMLGGILALLGILVVGSGFFAGLEEPIGSIPWRGIVLITVAFIFFGLTIRNLGVVPSLFITTLLAALASERMGLIRGIAVAAGLTVLSVVIFIYTLQLHLPLFGPWLRF